MITYNHEKYIRQAIEGVLAQETHYPYELNIFNDASTDKTDEVIREVIHQHPRGKWINYMVHEKNIGQSANYIWSIKNCSGKYIAICEGDDYWIDRQKLQKQVDILEQNPAYSFCFHQALRIDTVNNQYSIYPVSNWKSFDAGRFFSMTTIPMASVVFRNTFDLHFVNTHMQQDFPLLCNLLSHGNACFLQEVMSVFRVHASSFSYNRNAFSYMTKMINDIGEGAKTPAYSKDVRRHIAGVYMVHVIRMLDLYHQNLSRFKRICLIFDFLAIRRPGKTNLTFYTTLFKYILR